MYRVGIICSETYFREVPIQQFIVKLKKEFGPTAIVLGGGNSQGGDLYVKKYALLYGLTYREYNPAYTGANLYSAMGEDYYTKAFHPTHLQHRYQMLINDSDVVLFFTGDTVEPSILFAQKYAKKRKLKTASCD